MPRPTPGAITSGATDTACRARKDQRQYAEVAEERRRERRTMGFFNRLFSRATTTSGGRHVSEKSFQENLARQAKMSPQTLKQLREHGVNESMTLRLEYFFYTNAID